jgi:propanediol dehydratase small subunit
MTLNDLAGLDPRRDFPLATHRSELVRTPTGKRLEELTLDAVLNGDVTAEDLRITPRTLRLQAEIADAVGRPQLAENMRRAGELTAVPDERILEIYNALRPRASTKQELLEIADELESRYSAPKNAALVREAAEVYERRSLLAGAEQ